ncbi:beta strand repeat-containing protein [Magnetococcus marinus]|nr:MBG domain-containing protein [Magnetococcus marinus]
MDALPTGGNITVGEGSIYQSGVNMVIEQTSSKLIANWESFQIGADAQVTFQQPSASSIALNRVMSAGASEIFGRLNANGQVFLINPSGVIFGQNARIEVGGLVASTLDLSDDDFMQENYRFSAGESTGSIENWGSLNAAEGGYIALLSPRVRNEGDISAPKGTAVLAAGDEVSVDLYGDSLIKLTVHKGTLDALAENKGLVMASGGVALLSAKGVDAVHRAVVNNSGTVEAGGITTQGGRIFLTAAGGDVTNAGTLDVTSEQAKGGSITMTGETTTIASGARLNASGATGGGEIQVGGSWQNSNPDVAQSQQTVVEQGAELKANATDSGDGGTVVVWSDIHNVEGKTRVHGVVEAKGGEQGGDGGQVETSGHHLDVTGIQLALDAPKGAGGLWLLDPNNIEITNATSNLDDSSAPTYTSTDDGSQIDVATIEAQLNAGVVVKIQTASAGTNAEDGDIIINADISKTSGDDASLILYAYGNIVMDGHSITSISNELGVAFYADYNSSSDGAIVISGDSSITTNGGYFAAGGQSDYSGNAMGGADYANGFYLDGTISTGGGSVTIYGQGKSGGTGRGILIEGDSTIDAAGGSIMMVGTGEKAEGVLIKSSTGSASAPSTRIITSGDGVIAIVGMVADNGANASADESGVAFGDDSVIGAHLQAEDGMIVLTGTGGDFSPGDVTSDTANASGVRINGSLIETTGDGSIGINGTGPTADAGDGGDRNGVHLEDDTVIRTGSGVGGSGLIAIIGYAYGLGEGVDTNDGGTQSIISGSGGVVVAGQNYTGSADGLQLSGTINAVGGTIELSGIGGDGTDLADGGIGVYASGLTLGSDDTTSITITGTAKSGDAEGLFFTNTTTLDTSATGSITITGYGTGVEQGFQSNDTNTVITAGSGGLTIIGDDAEGNGYVYLKGAYTTEGGDITITGSGTNGKQGIYAYNATFDTLTSGQITFTGTSADSNGITLDGVTVGSDATDSITLTGTSLSNAGNGIFIDSGSSFDTSSDGSITITGYGSGDNEGFQSNISSNSFTAGSGLTITGDNTYGNGAVNIIGTFTTETGDIVITAAGEDGQESMYVSYATINTISSGTITLTGVSADDDGIYIKNSTFGSDATSAITITGTSESGNNEGVYVYSDSSFDTSSSGTITITGYGTGDQEAVQSNDSDNSFTAGSGGLTITGDDAQGNGAVYLKGTFTAEAGDIVITAAGGGGKEGFYGSSATINTLTSGNITIVASSADAEGFYANAVTIGSDTTDSITITGTSNSGDNEGIYLVGETDIDTSSSGSITLTGYGSGGDQGFQSNYNGITVTAGSGGLTITGDDTQGNGAVSLRGTFSSEGGDVVITGVGTNNFDGIYGNDVTIDTTGTITLTGTSDDGNGINLAYTNIGSDSTSSITITGTSLSGDNKGVYLENYSTLETSASGSITITGYAAGAWHGFESNTSTNSFSAGSGGLTIVGDDTYGNGGVYLLGTFTADGGDISITGEGANGIEGIYAEDATINTTTSGAITLTGSSADFDGIYLTGVSIGSDSTDSVTITGTSLSGDNEAIFVTGSSSLETSSSGSMTLTGAAAGAWQGFQSYSTGNTFSAGSGGLTIVGDDTYGNGGVTLVGSFTADGGDITITGKGANGLEAIYAEDATINTTTSGSITLTGSAADSDGIYLSSVSIGSDTTDSVTLTGTSLSGDNRGIYLTSATSMDTSASGSMTITGYGSGSKQGFRSHHVDNSMTAGSGGLTIVGDNTYGNGGLYLRGTFTAEGGDISITGAGADGLNGIYGDNVTINNITSGSITLTGTSSDSDGLSGSEMVIGSDATDSVSITGYSTADFYTGIYFGPSNTVESAADGSITVTGAGTGVFGYGVTFDDSTSTFSAGSGGLTIEGDATQGNGALFLAGSFTAVGGDIVVTGDATSILAGIHAIAATMTTTTSGNITLTGTSEGGDGIYFGSSSASTLTTAASGTMTVTGTGSVGGEGVAIHNTTLSAGSGGLTVTGTGGDSGHGVYLWEDTTLQATSGDISIVGTAGSTSANGVTIDSDDGLVVVQTVTAGHITITGSSTMDDGIEVRSDTGHTATISAAGSGNTTLEGTASNSDADDRGIELNDVAITTESGDITLTGQSASSSEGIGISEGNVSISSTDSGSITLIADRVDLTGSSNSISSSGVLLIQPYSASSAIEIGGSGGDLNLAASVFSDTLADGFSYIQIGDSDNSGGITVAGATSVADSLRLIQGSGNITLNDSLTISTAGDYLQLHTTGSGSQGGGGAIVADNLELLGSGGSYVLTAATSSTGNNVATLAADTGSVTYKDQDALTINSVNTTTGITATGRIAITTMSDADAADLTLSGDLSTTDTSTTAIVLNAGEDEAAGQTTLADSRADILYDYVIISTGADGVVTLLTGSINGSSALATALGSGSGRFRYGSDETTTNYMTALESGVNVVYREQPTLTLTPDAYETSYGDGVNPTAFSMSSGTLENGDSFIDPDSYTIASTGSSSSNVGSYDLSFSSLSSTNSLGYALSGATRTDGHTISTAALTITAENDSKTYDGDAYSGGNGVSYSGFVNDEESAVLGGSLSYGGTSQDATDAGSYTIIPSGLTSSNYAITFNNGTLTVNKAALSVTAENDSKTYDSEAYSGGNGVSYSGFVGDEDSAVLGGSISYGGTSQDATDAGSYSITPSGLTSDNYNISFNNGTLTVNQAALSITAENDSKTYDSEAYSGGNGVSYSGFVGDEDSAVLGGSISYGGTSQDATDAGSYSITPSGLTSSNYAITFNNGTLTVNKAALSVTAENDSKTYDSEAYSGGNGVSYSGFVGDEDSAVLGGSISYGGTSQDATDAGSYTIIPSGLTSSNYEITFNNGTLTVNKAALSVTAENDSKTYDSEAYSGGNGVSYSGFVGDEDSAVLGGSISYGGTSQDATDAGSYTIIPSGLTSSNYEITFNNGTLTVNKAALSVTAENDSKTYDSEAYSGGNGVSYSGFVGDEDSAVLGGSLSYGGTSQDATDAGSYSITPSGLTSDNYEISFNNGTLTVNKAALSVTAENDSKTYDSEAYSGGNGVSYSGFVGDEDSAVLGGSISYGGTSQDATDAGSYSITPSGLTSDNYNISFNNGTLTVNKAALSVTAENDSKTYDREAYSGGNGVSYSGFVGDEDSAVLGGSLSYGGTSQDATDAGSYTIIPSGLTSSNYEITFNNGTLTVNQAALSVTAENDGKTYDGNAYSGGNGVSYSGFVGDEDSAVLGGSLSYGGTSQDATDAGSYSITPGGLTSSNYAITFHDGTLSVNQVGLTVTANDDSKTYDGEGYTDGNGVVYSGFIDDEDSSVLGGELTYTGTSQGAVAVGTYAIMPSGLSATNYSFSYVAGSLSVLPKSYETNTPDTEADLVVAAPTQLEEIALSIPQTTQSIGEQDQIFSVVSGNETVVFLKDAQNGDIGGGMEDPKPVQVVAYRADTPPRVEDGFSVQAGQNAIRLRPLNRVDQEITSPGEAVFALGFTVQGAQGEVSFSVNQTQQGIVIKPNGQAAATLLEGRRDKVIGVALLQLRQQGSVALEQLKTIYLDLP